ncbi:hypothetical protein F2P56_001662 [Juglans regia]|uniref:sterol 3beta-glucosyltransferase n=1 Tax=Juglans regia TaxID=51240 RepID=A0A833XZL9_JUGRE|nr:hypothetical protein F2P56_001662 [Juglans regia]
MAHSPEKRRSDTETSLEVSVEIERDIAGGSGSDSEEVESKEVGNVAYLNNGGSSSPGFLSGVASKNVSEVNTLPAGVSNIDKLESKGQGQIKLERSKTERQRHNNIRAEEAAQIFDAKVSVQQKLKLLKRMATVKDDGTVEFEVPADVAPQVLAAGSIDACNEAVDDETLDATDLPDIPPLQIVMLIVGTRGDVQPFVAIGKRLQDYGHRVRLATHSNFKDFVLTAGLEFYPLGGDPKVLAGYMVKNKGFLPSGPSEIPVQRNQMKEIIYSLLPACKDPDMDCGIPFKADAIIANPPAYGHIHVAEALKVPIHIFFTMPWTPTSEFPHPLSRVKQQSGYRLSYQIVDSLIWLGIRDMINDVRKKKLKLRPVTYLSGSQGSDSDIPHGYIWSPHLVPKPKDWGPKVDVVGFCFLDLASNYEPPEPLVKWLEAGEKPVYIGFGSLVSFPSYFSSRGLRQGTRCLPFFVIVMDALSLMLGAVVGSGLLSGFKVGGPQDSLVTISHLLFADDTLLFCDVNPSHVQTLQALLLCSEVVLGFKVSSLPIRYLGLPLGATFKASTVWDGVLEKWLIPLNVLFSRAVNDWEMRAVSELLGLLYATQLGWDVRDKMVWMHSGNKKFSVRSWYMTLSRLNGVHSFPWKSKVPSKCPTTVVPFFGDQPFWGERVHARGVGPAPIPVDEFTLPKLVDAIKFMLDPKVKQHAVELAKAMESEDGVAGAVKAFFKHLPRKKPGLEPEPVPSSLFSISRCFGCS